MSMTVLAKRVRQSLNGVTTYTYNRSNELTNSTGSGSTTLYGYDAVGNMVSRNVTTIGTARWTYTWDVPGNLVKASNGTTVQGYYAYDGLGRMMEAKEASSTIFYAYHGTETLAEQIGSSGAFNDYIYTNGIRLARAGTYTNTVNYYHTDGLGSTRLRTDINGNVVFADGYQPFGQDNGTPAGSETYKFTGKPFSVATGLYHDYQRWYDPSVGRFISPDPSGGINLYTYAINNPLRYVDPDGASPIDVTLKLLSGFLLSVSHSFNVQDSRLIGWLPPEYWGSWRVGATNDHSVFWGFRPKFPGIRDNVQTLLKFDRPDLTLKDPSQWTYHVSTWKEYDRPIPDSWGSAADIAFSSARWIGTGLLVAGLVMSAIDIWTAYNQDASSGRGFDNTIRVGAGEAGGWAGALLGGEVGMEIGTAVFPGVGTIIGGLAGATIGAFGGQQGTEWFASLVLGSTGSFASSIYDETGVRMGSYTAF
jgi:RHS repeat-associated protein